MGVAKPARPVSLEVKSLMFVDLSEWPTPRKPGVGDIAICQHSCGWQ